MKQPLSSQESTYISQKKELLHLWETLQNLVWEQDKKLQALKKAQQPTFEIEAQLNYLNNRVRSVEEEIAYIEEQLQKLSDGEKDEPPVETKEAPKASSSSNLLFPLLIAACLGGVLFFWGDELISTVKQFLNQSPEIAVSETKSEANPLPAEDLIADNYDQSIQDPNESNYGDNQTTSEIESTEEFGTQAPNEGPSGDTQTIYRNLPSTLRSPILPDTLDFILTNLNSSTVIPYAAELHIIEVWNEFEWDCNVDTDALSFRTSTQELRTYEAMIYAADLAFDPQGIHNEILLEGKEASLIAPRKKRTFSFALVPDKNLQNGYGLFCILQIEIKVKDGESFRSIPVLHYFEPVKPCNIDLNTQYQDYSPIAGEVLTETDKERIAQLQAGETGRVEKARRNMKILAEIQGIHGVRRSSKAELQLDRYSFRKRRGELP